MKLYFLIICSLFSVKTFSQELLLNRGFEIPENYNVFPYWEAEVNKLLYWNDVTESSQHSPEWYFYDSFFRIDYFNSNNPYFEKGFSEFGYIGMRPCEGITQRMAFSPNKGDRVRFEVMAKIQNPSNSQSIGARIRPPYTGVLEMEFFLSKSKLKYLIGTDCSLNGSLTIKRQRFNELWFTYQLPKEQWFKLSTRPIRVDSDDYEWFLFHIHNKYTVAALESSVEMREYMLFDEVSLKRLTCGEAAETCEYANGAMTVPTVINSIMPASGKLILGNLDDVQQFEIEVKNQLGQHVYSESSRYCPNGFQEDYVINAVSPFSPANLNQGSYFVPIDYWNGVEYCNDVLQFVVNHDFPYMPQTPNNCACRPLNVPKACCGDLLEALQYEKICSDVNPVYQSLMDLTVGVSSPITAYSGDDVRFLAGNSITIGSGFYNEPGSDVLFSVQPCEYAKSAAPPQFIQNENLTVFTDSVSMQTRDISITASPDISIYPNPVLETLNIRNNTNEVCLLESFSASGAFIGSKVCAKSESCEFYLDTPGLYILKLKSESYATTHKIIRQ